MSIEKRIVWITCPECKGAGSDMEDSSKNCYMCKGTGIIEGEIIAPYPYESPEEVQKKFDELFVEKKKKE